jgi:transposase-like protein
MTELTSALSMDDLFKGRHFDREIIVLCVRWYLRFKLSFRDLAEVMADRGISLAHTTIMRWIQRYVPEFERRWNRFARRLGSPGASTKPTSKSEVAGRIFTVQ